MYQGEGIGSQQDALGRRLHHEHVKLSAVGVPIQVPSGVAAYEDLAAC